MDERIHKYFYEELYAEERISFLRDVDANEELTKQFAGYQNMHALLNLGHQMENRCIGKQKCDQFIKKKQRRIAQKQWLRWVGYASSRYVERQSFQVLTNVY